jgi:hypothetical protein
MGKPAVIASTVALGIVVSGAALVAPATQAQASPSSPGVLEGHFMKTVGDTTHCMTIKDPALTGDGRGRMSYRLTDPDLMTSPGFGSRWDLVTGAKKDWYWDKKAKLSRYEGHVGEGKRVKGPKTKVKIKFWNDYPSSESHGLQVRTKAGKSPKLEAVPASQYFKICPYD